MAANTSPRQQVSPMQPTFPGSSAQVSSPINRSWQQHQIQSVGVQNNPLPQTPSIQSAPNTQTNPLADPNLVQKQIHEFHRLQVMLRHIQQQRQRQQEQKRRQELQQQQEQQRRQQLLQRIQVIQRARAQGLIPQNSGHSAKINQMEKMIRDMIKYRDQLKQEAAFRQKTRQVDATNMLHREDVQSGPSLLVMDKDMVTAVPVVTTKKPNGSLGQSMIVFAKTANIHSNVDSQTNIATEQAKLQTTTPSPKPVAYQQPGFQQLGIQQEGVSHPHQLSTQQQHNQHHVAQSHMQPQQPQQMALPMNNLPTLQQTNMIPSNANNGLVNSQQTNIHGHQQNNPNGNQAFDHPAQHHGSPSVHTHGQHYEQVIQHKANQNAGSPQGNIHSQAKHVHTSGPTQIQLPPLETVQQNPQTVHQRTDPPPIQLPTLNMLSVKNQQPLMQPVQQHSSRQFPAQLRSSNSHIPAPRSLPSPNNHIHHLLSTEPPNQWKHPRSQMLTTTTPVPDVPRIHSNGIMQLPQINRRLLKRPPRPRIVTTTTPEPLFHNEPLTLMLPPREQTGAIQHEVPTVPPVVTEHPHRFVPTPPPNTTPKPSINDIFQRMSRPRPQKVRISFRKSGALTGSLSGGISPPQVTTPTFPVEPTTVPFIPTQHNNRPVPTTTPVVPTHPTYPPVHRDAPQYQRPVEQIPTLPPPLPTVEQVQNYQMNSNQQYPVHQYAATEPSIRYYTTTEASYHHQGRSHYSEQIRPVPFSHPLHNPNQNQNAHRNDYIQQTTTTTTQAPLHLSDLQKWESEMKINSNKPVAGMRPRNNVGFQSYHQVTTTTTEAPTPKRTENPLAKLLKLLQRKNASIKFASDRQQQQRFTEPRTHQPRKPSTTTESPQIRVQEPQAPFNRHSSGLVSRHPPIQQSSRWTHMRAPTAAPSTTHLQTARNNFRRFETSPFSTKLPLNNHRTSLQPTAVPVVQPPSPRQTSNQRGNRQPTQQRNQHHRNMQHVRHSGSNTARRQPQRVNAGAKSQGPINPAQLLIAALIQALQSGNLLKQLKMHQQQPSQFQQHHVQESEPMITHTQTNSQVHYNEQHSQPAVQIEEKMQPDVPYYNTQENHVQQHQQAPRQINIPPSFENQNNNNNQHQVVRYDTKSQAKRPQKMPDLSMLPDQDVEFTDVNTGFGGESPPPVIIQRIPKNSRSRSNGNSVSYELPSMALHENSAVVIDTSTGDDSNSTSDTDDKKSNSTDDKEVNLPKLSTIFASKITSNPISSISTPATTVKSITLPESDIENKEDYQEENIKQDVFQKTDTNDQEKSFHLQLPSMSPINIDYETNDVSTPPPLFTMTKKAEKNDKDDITTTTRPTTKATTEKTISTTVEKITTVEQEQFTMFVSSTTSTVKPSTTSRMEDDSYDKTPKPTTTATTTTTNLKTTTPTSTTMIPTTTTSTAPSTSTPSTTTTTSTTTTSTTLPTTTIPQSTSAKPATQIKTTTEEYRTVPELTTLTSVIPLKERDEGREYNFKTKTTTLSTTPTTTSQPSTAKTTSTTSAVNTSPFFFMTTMDYRALYPELFGLRPLMHEPVEPTTTTKFVTTTIPSTTTTRSTTTPSTTTATTTTLKPTTPTLKPIVLETTPKPTTTTYKTTTYRRPSTTTTLKPVVTTPFWQRETTQFTTDVFPFTLPTTIDYRDLFAEMFGRNPVPAIYGAQESALEENKRPQTTISPTPSTTTAILTPSPKKTAYVGLSLENSMQYRKASNISPTVLSNTVESTMPQLSLPGPTIRDTPRFFVSNNLNGGHGLQHQAVRSTTPRSVRVLGRDIVVQTTAQSFAAKHLSGQEGVKEQPSNHISDFVQNGNAGSLSQQKIIQRQMAVPETMSNVLSPKPTPHIDVVDIPYDPHLDRASTLLSGNKIPKQLAEPKVADASEALPGLKGSNEPLNVIDLNAFSTNSLAANPNVPQTHQNGVADVSTQLDSLLSALGSDIMIHEQKSSDGHVQYKIHGGNQDLPAFVLRTGYKWADTFG
uniref:Mucin-17-like n=1 Tax=Crassostrea virginica TaxID=6565 RepID=A0A8B8B537_CRAVI|nr:mucin-17-like [Crassostrea virginica]